MLLKPLILALLPSLTLANTRQPDPGVLDDTICTANVLKMLGKTGPSLSNTLLLWPKNSCCTTTDCSVQKFSCPANPAHTGTGGDVCCYKASGKGTDAGTCVCAIDTKAEGTCF